MTIILARVRLETRVISTAGIDLGRAPKTEKVPVAEALCWLNHGTVSDVVKANAYADREGYQVFLYAEDERDPLGKARREILKRA